MKKSRNKPPPMPCPGCGDVDCTCEEVTPSTTTPASSSAGSSRARTTDPADYVMRFDGGSRGNPGIAGCGAVLLAGDDEVYWGYEYVGDRKTNNDAEYSGLLLGLRAAVAAERRGGRPMRSLKVEGDSNLVVKQVNGVWKCEAANLQGYLREAQGICKELCQRRVKMGFGSYFLGHIPRAGNTRADALANSAMDEQRSNEVWLCENYG